MPLNSEKNFDEHPHQFKLVGADGKIYSFLYASASDAADAAKRLWPEQEQDPDRTGVPTTWLDPLLSGPNKVGNLPARETEALLRGVQDRIRALKIKA